MSCKNRCKNSLCYFLLISFILLFKKNIVSWFSCFKFAWFFFFLNWGFGAAGRCKTWFYLFFKGKSVIKHHKNCEQKPTKLKQLLRMTTGQEVFEGSIIVFNVGFISRQKSAHLSKCISDYKQNGMQEKKPFNALRFHPYTWYDSFCCEWYLS